MEAGVGPTKKCFALKKKKENLSRIVVAAHVYEEIASRCSFSNKIRCAFLCRKQTFPGITASLARL